MANESGQNFGNHAQLVPGYHYITSPLGLIYVIWSIKRLISMPGADTAYALVGSLAIFGAIAFARVSPLKVQDRVIRLEERLRLTRVLPADLQSRIEEIRPGHLVALRFAPDAEVTDLVRKVLADPGIKPKEIKAQIRNWKADYFRA
jgi:hypothetical protein